MSAVDRRPTLSALCALAVALLAPTGCGGSDRIAVGPDTVVLLHGLGRSASSMKPLAEHLREQGFQTHNLDYPSTDHSAEELVAWLDGALRDCCNAGDGSLHFVTHSLGGLLVRAQLALRRPANLGRAVLIAPPNRGSEIVDEFGDNPLFEAALGPVAKDLGTHPESFPNRLGPADFEVGIIAGTGSINPLGSAILPGDDDGTVSVENTRLEGAADFIVIESNHTFIMQDAAVAEQVVHFLREGRFDHAPATDAR
jgi:pimeloyl-ACP methyl ester carboxylesterase